MTMTMQRRGTRSAGFRGPRRKFAWVSGALRFLNSAGFVSDLLLESFNPRVIARGSTLTKIMLTIDAFPVVTPTISNRVMVGIRKGLTDQIPDPNIDAINDDPLNPWILTAQGVSPDGSNQTRWAGPQGMGANLGYFESSAQRKLTVNETLFLIVDNPDGQNYDLNVWIRMLFRLP